MLRELTMVCGCETEYDVKTSFGEHVEVGGHCFTLRGIGEVIGADSVAARGDFEVRSLRGGVPSTMAPEKRLCRVQLRPPSTPS